MRVSAFSWGWCPIVVYWIKYCFVLSDYVVRVPVGLHLIDNLKLNIILECRVLFPQHSTMGDERMGVKNNMYL